MIWRILERTLKPLMIAAILFLLVIVFFYQVQNIKQTKTEYAEAQVVSVQLRHSIRQIGRQAEFLEVAREPAVIKSKLVTMQGFIETAKIKHESLLRGNPTLQHNAPMPADIAGVYGSEQINTHARVRNYLDAASELVRHVKAGTRPPAMLMASLYTSRIDKSLTRTIKKFASEREVRYSGGVIALLCAVAGLAFCFSLVVLYVKPPSPDKQAETFIRASSKVGSVASILTDMSSLQEIRIARDTIYYEPETDSKIAYPALPLEDPVTEPKAVPEAKQKAREIEFI
ncbi:MAG: hypothetical protein ACRBF0_09740 [Calditrichia bacterium]